MAHDLSAHGLLHSHRKVLKKTLLHSLKYLSLQQTGLYSTFPLEFGTHATWEVYCGILALWVNLPVIPWEVLLAVSRSSQIASLCPLRK